MRKSILLLNPSTTDFQFKLPSATPLTSFSSDRPVFLTNLQNVVPSIRIDQQGNLASPLREGFLIGTSQQNSFKWNNKVIKTTYLFDVNGMMRSSSTSFKLGN